MVSKSVAGLRACTWVWLLMLGLTLLTWLIGRSGWEGIGMSLAVLGFALIKGQLVGDWFMGLRQVRGGWRWPVSLWLLVPGGLITVAFVVAG